MEVRAVDLTFDASHLTGAATIAMRDRLALGARLTIDQLNLDAYVSGDAAPARRVERTCRRACARGADHREDAPEQLTRVTVLQAISDALVSFDANIDASVDTLIWRGQPIRKVRVTGTLENRDLTLRELSVSDLGGAQGKLSGYFQGIGTSAAEDPVRLRHARPRARPRPAAALVERRQRRHLRRILARRRGRPPGR